MLKDDNQPHRHSLFNRMNRSIANVPNGRIAGPSFLSYFYAEYKGSYEVGLNYLATIRLQKFHLGRTAP